MQQRLMMSLFAATALGCDCCAALTVGRCCEQLGGHVIAEETRDYWRCGQAGENCPSTQRYHFGHNAETYWLIGQAMAKGMLKMMSQM